MAGMNIIRRGGSLRLGADLLKLIIGYMVWAGAETAHAEHAHC